MDIHGVVVQLICFAVVGRALAAEKKSYMSGQLREQIAK